MKSRSFPVEQVDGFCRAMGVAAVGNLMADARRGVVSRQRVRRASRRIWRTMDMGWQYAFGE